MSKNEIKAPQHVTHESGAVYDAAEVAKHKTFDDFKAEADAQSQGNPSVHFGGWQPDQREANLRSIYDQAVEMIRPKAQLPASKEKPETPKEGK